MTITNIIKDLRTRKQITQEQLAQAVGVSRQTIIAIEKGNYTPSLLLAMQLAEFFHVPTDNLFSIKN
jgi:putative transcriptional regulator